MTRGESIKLAGDCYLKYELGDSLTDEEVEAAAKEAIPSYDFNRKESKKRRW